MCPRRWPGGSASQMAWPTGAGVPRLVPMAHRVHAVWSDPRPVAVPDDVDDSRHIKATGVVTLPPNVRWSGPPKTYDLNDPIDLARVYEQVLREGTVDDVLLFIDVDVLGRLWDTLVVPARVRTAWAGWFRGHRGVEMTC